MGWTVEFAGWIFKLSCAPVGMIALVGIAAPPAANAHDANAAANSAAKMSLNLDISTPRTGWNGNL